MTPLNPPVIPRRTYFVIWIVLLLLLLLNWGLAQFNLGPFNLIVTLAIPFVQMLLMLLYLMHVRFNTPLTWVFVAAGFIWLMILIDLSLTDFLWRGSVPGRFGQSWQHGAWPSPPPGQSPNEPSTNALEPRP